MNPGGFSSFGSTTGFGTSSSTNLFGQSQPAQSSIFGSSTTTNTAAQPQQSSLFSGGGFGGFQSGTTATTAQTGTTLKFQAPSGQDTINKNGSAQTINTNHQCITAMKEYKAKSLEELRFEDYQANRKTAQQTSSFLGASTGSSLFKSSTTATTTSGFGGSSLFGGSTTQSTANRPLLFGSSTSTTTTPASTSLFGQSTQPKSIFGSAAASTTTTTGFGGFGSTQPASTGVFGGQQQQQSSTLFGGIGQSTTAAAPSAGIFGSSTATTGSTGIFGQQAAKPAFGGFGSSTTSTTTQSSPFSFNSQPAAATTTTPSLFGSSTTATTQSPLSAAKPFGSTGFGSSLTGSTTTGGFGSTTATQPATGGIFGSTPAKPAFGGSTTTTGFGGFGSTTTATQPTATTGGIFGGFGSTAATTTQQATTASPFGQTQSTGLGSTFGQTQTSTGGIFGSTTQAQPSTTAATGGIFGSTTSTGFGSGLSTGFGATTGNTTLGGLGNTSTTGGIFGGATTQTQPASQFSFGGTGSSLAGNTSLTGGFGSGLTNTTVQGTSFGGLNTTQQQQQLQLQQKAQQGLQEPLVQQQISALSNSPYGSSYHHVKKDDIFKPVSPLAQRPFITEATSPVKLASILSSGISEVKGGLSQSFKITPKPLSTVSLNKKTDLFEGLEDEEVPCFYPRKNIKKLLFKPTCNYSNLNSSGRSSPSNSVVDHKIDFTRKSNYQDQNDQNAGLGRFNQNNEYQGGFNGQITTDSTNISDDGHDAGDNQSEGNHQPSAQHPANIVLERPGYFTIPSMQELGSMTDSKGDCMVENFSIGRVDYGCITFPGFTNVSNMNLDEIVHIRRKEVHIYPDETKKPQIGQGLNKTAEVTLHRIWPTCKETKKPITDPIRIIDMGYNKKIEKATIEMGAQFIDYDPSTGSWTFKVKHFSKYGLHDSDDDDDSKPIAFHQSNPIKMCNAASNFLSKEQSASRELDVKQEKDMIQKQLKLIETRRLELMQQRKSQNGNNLNTITNQQWEMLNEYVPQAKPAFNDTNVLHLELSEESQIINTDDEDTDKRSTNSCEPKNKTLRKALILDNETDDTDNDFDKENASLYPNLSEFRKNKKTNKKSMKLDGIYPNLNNYEQNDSYHGKTMSKFQIDQNDLNHGNLHGDALNDDEQMNTLPFIVASSNDRMLASTRANKTLMKAFFGEEQVTEDYMNMLEDDTKTKIASLVQKPQQFGLLKRGLGGMSNEELLGNRMSFKREPYHPQSKSPKVTAMSLTIADVQQRVGSNNLKPKNWNKYSSKKVRKFHVKKHTNQSLTETIENDTNQLKSLKLNEMQSSDDQALKLKFINLEESILYKNQMLVADIGLFQSRRFRVQMSFNPNSCTYTSLSLNTKSTDLSTINLAVPLMITLGNTPILQSLEANNLEAKMNVVKENCEEFLKIQLELTDWEKMSDSSNLMNSQQLNLFRTKPGNVLIKKCCDYVKDMRNNIGDHPDADNIEHMKSVWSLCQNLWGDIPENYKINPTNESPKNNYENEQIRKRLLSEWLADVSAHRIERECKMYKFHKNKDNHMNSIFSMLTGNRLLDACKLATDCQDYRLALLLAQSSGGNETFRNMIKKQIKEWLISGTDKYLNSERLKFYVLISGCMTLNSDNDTQIINVCENLDWKRQFGLHLWYNCLPINSIHDSLNLFEQSLSNNLCNKPLPPYLEDSISPESTNNSAKPSTTSSSKMNASLLTGFKSSQFEGQPTNSTKKELFDTCFHLIKLYCDDKYPIADIISPLSHNSNQLDYRLSWHLAMALVSLNYNFISKECLETLHESYASQLQSIGLWHWSVFVLMHLGDENRRETCVKNYLSHYVTSESELNEKEKFLIEKLMVPSEWVFSYKALRAKYEYQYESQFKLLVKAHHWNEAHSVLIDLLAPDLFIKQNLKTLNEYLIPLSKESESINKWNLGGQIYIDYIKLNQKAQVLFDFSKSNEGEEEQKLLGAELLKEINDQIISLSTRIKELKDLHCTTDKSSKKLLVCIDISKMLLKFFNTLIELNSNELNQSNDNSNVEFPDSDSVQIKKFTKPMCDKAFKLTNSIPYHEIIQAMIMTKTKHTRTYLMSFRPY